MSSSNPKQALYDYIRTIVIPMKTIASATNNFSDDNLIAQGSYAKVYKGQLPQSGELIDIAVRKCLQPNEKIVIYLMLCKNLKHPNIVSIFKVDDTIDQAFLINKSEANESLDKHLSDSNLTWMQRLRICVGVARALSYIHHYDAGENEYVIHGNIKSSKILLDREWEPKLHDFRCAMKCARNHLFVTDKYDGTLEYMDPAFEKTGGLSHKSDVFSFGVVLFEVLFGRKAFIPDQDKWYFARLAYSHYERGTLDDMIDPDLRKQMDLQSFNIFSEAAYCCLKEQRSRRPNINQILKRLERALEQHRKHPSLLALKEVQDKKHLMLSANEVLYDSSNVKLFHLKPSDKSRFREVIEVLRHQVLCIKSKIASQMLSPDTEYECFLVFKLSQKCGLHCPVKVRDVFDRKNKEPEILYFRSPNQWNDNHKNHVPREREDGWMEVNVWSFNSEYELKNDSISINLKLISYEGTMSGLIVCGLELRPTCIENDANCAKGMSYSRGFGVVDGVSVQERYVKVHVDHEQKNHATLDIPLDIPVSALSAEVYELIRPHETFLLWPKNAILIQEISPQEQIKQLVEIIATRPNFVQVFYDRWMKRDNPTCGSTFDINSTIFGEKETFHVPLVLEEVLRFLTNKELDVSIISLYAMIIHEEMIVHPSGNICAFLNPHLVDARSCDENPWAVETYLREATERGQDIDVFLLPYHQGCHWSLLIFLKNGHRGFILDSVKKLKTWKDYTITNIINQSLEVFDWEIAMVQQQTSSWECGYYVMRWIYEFVIFQQHHFPLTVPWIQNVPYDQSLLDAIVGMWINGIVIPA